MSPGKHIPRYFAFDTSPRHGRDLLSDKKWNFPGRTEPAIDVEDHESSLTKIV
jgi:hypothetical protein